MNRMTSGRTISATFVRLLHEYLAKSGHDARHVLGDSVPSADVTHCSIAHWVALLERASRHLGDDLLGLRLGQTIAPSHLGTLGFLLQSMPTLGAALKKLERYQRLVYDQSPMCWQEGAGHVDLCWSAEDGLPGRLADDTSISALVHYCGLIARGDATPLRVTFINAAPEQSMAYRPILGCPVEFGAEVTSVRFSRDSLALPLRGADASLSHLMERQMTAWLAHLPQSTPIVGEVRDQVARLLRDGEPGLVAVAEALGLAARTLQRRLGRAGTSFRHELETVRRLLAESYLRDRRLSVADVAQLVGYSEHSALTRGFRQWTGLSPERWRESVL